jgi:hypothetical protein
MRVSTGGWGNFIPVFLSAFAEKAVSLGGIHVSMQLIHQKQTKQVFKGGSGRQVMLRNDSSRPLFLLNQFVHDAWLVRSASESQ